MIAIIVGVGTAIAAILSWTRYQAWIVYTKRRRRSLNALAAEVDAESLLERSGFEIVDRQIPGTMTLVLDGVPCSYGLRADLLVTDGEHDYIAEVKTGCLVSQLNHAATRRQLLEYAIAFEVDGILLVNADTGAITEVDFGSLWTS